MVAAIRTLHRVDRQGRGVFLPDVQPPTDVGTYAPGDAAEEGSWSGAIEVVVPTVGDEEHLLRRVIRVGLGDAESSRAPPDEPVVLEEEGLKVVCAAHHRTGSPRQRRGMQMNEGHARVCAQLQAFCAEPKKKDEKPYRVSRGPFHRPNRSATTAANSAPMAWVVAMAMPAAERNATDGPPVISARAPT